MFTIFKSFFISFFLFTLLIKIRQIPCQSQSHQTLAPKEELPQTSFLFVLFLLFARMSASSSSSTSSSSTKLNALVLGSTGATGKPLLDQLSQNTDRVGRITALVRRAPTTENARVNHVVVDFDAMVAGKADDAVFRGHDVVFCCMGTTRKDAGSAEAFVKVDHDYVLAAAKLAHSAAVPHFSIVTAQGANADSWFLYMQTKGRIENALKALSFGRLSIFQPGLLLRPENNRLGEKMATWFIPSLPTATLAAAMLQDALDQPRPVPAERRPEVEVFGNNVIKQIASSVPPPAL
jgi:oxidoreductase